MVLSTTSKTRETELLGSRLLAGMMIKGKPKKSSSGQMSLPWDKQRLSELTEVHEVAEKFIQANCYLP
ncbi:MAG: hypothetical protein RMY36_026800 [Nostoc sp. SerVER01]|nr:hypothetical protein [Nostoc sp. SerVER01]